MLCNLEEDVQPQIAEPYVREIGNLTRYALMHNVLVRADSALETATQLFEEMNMRGKGGRGRHGGRHGRGDYARTTITVPSELKQRMKAVGDYVNWSSVACQAFDTKLKDLVQQEEVENLDQVVERLRKLTAERSDSVEHKTGVEAGKHWAMNRATPTQLASLERFRSELSEPEWREIFQHRRGIRELTDCLMNEDSGRGRGRRFWREILDEKPDGPDFFAGFAIGALEVWNAVKDRV